MPLSNSRTTGEVMLRALPSESFSRGSLCSLIQWICRWRCSGVSTLKLTVS